MNISMLWLDTSGSPVKERVLAAAAYFRKKYTTPRTVYIPDDELEESIKVGRISVVPDHRITPRHMIVSSEEHDLA